MFYTHSPLEIGRTMNTPEANNDTLLYQVAKMYYIDGMSQDDVAKSVGFSRSYVSRLIDRAKERRIVTFVVTNPMLMSGLTL